MEETIRELDGGNMDIDMTSRAQDIAWKQDPCPWNTEENTVDHRCAVKNKSICKFFRGIKPPDKVLCAYPSERT